MLDFISIVVKKTKKGENIISPEFNVGMCNDLMVRSNKFFAVWDEETGLWNKNEFRVQELVDAEIKKKYDELKTLAPDMPVTPLYFSNYSLIQWVHQ